jgi:predicted Zn-dependent protease
VAWFSGARRSFTLLAVALTAMFALTTGVARAYKRQRTSLAESYASRARDLEAQGRYDDAIEQYRRALEFDPSDPGYRLALARDLFQTRRFTEAEAHLAELHEEDPTDAIVNLTLARVYAKQNDVRDAVAWYHRAVYGLWSSNAAQNRVQARLELIDFLARRGDRKQVIGELMELYAEAPEDVRLRLRIGRMLLQYEAAPNAEEVFQDVVTANPRFQDGWVALADAQIAQGKYVEARSSLRHAWHLDPHDQNLWKRIETVNDIIALDPALPTLTSAERLNRSTELLSRSLEALQSCAAGKTLSDQQQKDISAANDILHPKRKQPREGLIPRTIALAVQLGHERADVCGGAPPDAVLSAVLNLVEKQP